MARVLILNRDLNRDFYHKIEGGKTSKFFVLYFPCLFLIVIYHLLSVIYRIVSKDRTKLQDIKLSSKESEEISRKYEKKIDEIYPVYTWLVLQDERQAGRIPAWEGIRIVREI
ncbi:MAG: hypothetical protein F6K10_12165 [Moorea sp. SIO2B7]|nr:hypothetical protein [Moorena sp. SIO2B7]